MRVPWSACLLASRGKLFRDSLKNRPPSAALGTASRREISRERVAAGSPPLLPLLPPRRRRFPSRFFHRWHWVPCRGYSSPARSRYQNGIARSSGRSRPTLERKARVRRLKSNVGHRDGTREIKRALVLLRTKGPSLGSPRFPVSNDDCRDCKTWRQIHRNTTSHTNARTSATFSRESVEVTRRTPDAAARWDLFIRLARKRCIIKWTV